MDVDTARNNEGKDYWSTVARILFVLLIQYVFTNGGHVWEPTARQESNWIVC